MIRVRQMIISSPIFVTRIRQMMLCAHFSLWPPHFFAGSVQLMQTFAKISSYIYGYHLSLWSPCTLQPSSRSSQHIVRLSALWDKLVVSTFRSGHCTRHKVHNTVTTFTKVLRNSSWEPLFALVALFQAAFIKVFATLESQSSSFALATSTSRSGCPNIFASPPQDTSASSRRQQVPFLIMVPLSRPDVHRSIGVHLSRWHLIQALLLFAPHRSQACLQAQTCESTLSICAMSFYVRQHVSSLGPASLFSYFFSWAVLCSQGRSLWGGVDCHAAVAARPLLSRGQIRKSHIGAFRSC